MTDQARRKELRTKYQQTRPEAGVYRILNSQNGRALLGSAANLAGVRSKLEFARSVDGVLDQRPGKDVSQFATWLGGRGGARGSAQRFGEDLRQFGIGAFSLEVLEVLETGPEMTAGEILEDLAALEELWREKLESSLLY